MDNRYDPSLLQSAYSLGCEREKSIPTIFKIAYGFMFLGLAVSGLVAWHVAKANLFPVLLRGPWLIVCIVAELALVWGLSANIRKLSAPVAGIFFLVYAALNGLTLSVVFVAYELAFVQRVFFITAGMFGGAALWATFSKSDLSGLGSICGMALWGLILGSLVNLFFKSSAMDWFLSFAGVLVFTGLAAYDARTVRELAAAEGSTDAATLRKAGIMAALSLYLDFINLFLYLLRLLGRRR